MNKTIKALQTIDWNFSDKSNTKDIHSIHSYPAKFIPQISRNLIELLHPDDSSIILDPFCGSGTTLVEANNFGLDAWGVDINPLACLIGKVKTTPLPIMFNNKADQIVEAANEQILKNNVQIPEIPRLDHWFKPEIQLVLASLVKEIKKEKNQPIKDALQVALSSIIVRVSNQESDTRYAAIEKNISQEDVFIYFKKAVKFIVQSLEPLSNNISNHYGKATILNRDILSLTPDDLPKNISLVITSPPYPNKYEYWLYHKYRMYWLDMDPLIVKEREIGARPHYFKKNHQTEHDFERQMGVCFKLLSQIMIPSGKACFVVGHSIIHGRIIDNVALLQRAALQHGFITEGIIERNIPNTRKSFNPSHVKIKTEHLIVFSLEKKP